MTSYSPMDFQTTENEIARAISDLKRHGINLNLPTEIKNQISAQTLFDGDDGLFKELISDTKVYFEYGCGKSTDFALKYSDSEIFSVDTSAEWVKKINLLNDGENNDRLNLKWIDVGPLGDWGTPLTFSKRSNFKNYAGHFWLINKSPDLVLIDGRFRIFCFLTSLKYAVPGTKILFDDYKDRSYYHVVEEFCTKVDTCGRQALFEVSATDKLKITDEILLTFQNVIG